MESAHHASFPVIYLKEIKLMAVYFAFSKATWICYCSILMVRRETDSYPKPEVAPATWGEGGRLHLSILSVCLFPRANLNLTLNTLLELMCLTFLWQISSWELRPYLDQECRRLTLCPTVFLIWITTTLNSFDMEGDLPHGTQGNFPLRTNSNHVQTQNHEGSKE